VPVIRKSVEQLGFKFADIKILLGSHAHADHMEGDATVKELTGARVMAMAGLASGDVQDDGEIRPANVQLGLVSFRVDKRIRSLP
jgi:glyoxylase-like metal-dependent hydrolase (beta-lactamase superfamily II)